MIRAGLCCGFREQPIRFRNTTVAAMSRLSRQESLKRLQDLCLENAASLLQSLKYCHKNQIGAFRIMSQILPLRTHPILGYSMSDLPDGDAVSAAFRACGDFVREHSLRTSFHPDQFVVLNSPRPEVVVASIREIEYQSEVAEWVGADVVNIHAGGVYGSKDAALSLLEQNLNQLSESARSRLTLENDDRSYTPADLLPVCHRTGIPLVYDVHHHRCNPDGLSIEDATQSAIATWNREPMFHISSPAEGWSGPKPERHHELIDLSDFPECWSGISMTVDIEARGKEVAVLQLMKGLRRRARSAEVWYVYLLRCSDGSLYTGATNDVAARLTRHQEGTGAKYTRGRRPVEVVYQEQLLNQGEALRREASIKALSRAQKEALINNAPGTAS